MYTKLVIRRGCCAINIFVLEKAKASFLVRYNKYVYNRLKFFRSIFFYILGSKMESLG